MHSDTVAMNCRCTFTSFLFADVSQATQFYSRLLQFASALLENLMQLGKISSAQHFKKTCKATNHKFFPQSMLCHEGNVILLAVVFRSKQEWLLYYRTENEIAKCWWTCISGLNNGIRINKLIHSFHASVAATCLRKAVKFNFTCSPFSYHFSTEQLIFSDADLHVCTHKYVNYWHSETTATWRKIKNILDKYKTLFFFWRVTLSTDKMIQPISCCILQTV